MKTERELALDCLKSLWLECDLQRKQARDNAIKSEDNGDENKARYLLGKYMAWKRAKENIAKHVQEAFGVNIEKHQPAPLQVRGTVNIALDEMGVIRV